ncbi:hypothetical protein IAU59_003024 [Kwoniella sp. CBS 9459]
MDAKSLLRAKKAEARIKHPYASYNAAGVLRCSICAVPVKQWDAHLLTKQHRTSVSREKAEREKAQAQAQAQAAKAQSQSKRPAEESISGGQGESSKRAKVSKVENGIASSSILPAGFFSAGNGPSTLPGSDDEDEDQEQTQDQAGPSSGSNASATAGGPPAPTGDSELDDFLSSLTQDEPSTSIAPPLAVGTPTTVAPTTAAGRRKTYKEVIPGQASYEAAPVRIVQDSAATDGQVGQQEAEEEPEESEQERRARLEREEREEIVQRLEEEERAQEDADSRVASLKARMEMIKKRREARGGGQKATKRAAGDANGA